MTTAAIRPRVVSLIASATETLHALGASELQVARSHECDWPDHVRALPQLTRPKLKVDGASRDIDLAVKALVEQGLAVYEVDADALQRIAPDIILTQDQCEACAVSLADVQRAVATWTGCTANIVSLRPHTLADVYTDNQRIAEAIGDRDAGAELNSSMQARFTVIADVASGRPAPRFAFIEWIDPPMSGGHWMPELIATAGGVNVFGTHGAQSPWITIGDLTAADPDIILIAPCGYEIAKTRDEMGALDASPAWRALRAVREQRVYLADGNAFFNRPGPRLVDSAEILLEILHPGAASFGHMGRNVIRHELEKHSRKAEA